MFLKIIKDKLYYHFVEKNPIIKEKYQHYINEDILYHKNHRFISWCYMISLNMTYGGKNRASRCAAKQSHAAITTVIAKNSALSPFAKPKSVPELQLPYLEGAESSLARRPKPHHFVKDLLKYDVISFDIFDTLIFRPFTKPSDLFMLLQEKFDYFNFQEIRINAEKRAREISDVIYHTREINIWDIYDIIERETGINKAYAVEAELQCEIEMCFANPYMKRVFDILKSQNKRIIAVSDMYLPKDMLEKLLAKCGYIGFEEVFASCDFKISKAQGKLYTVVKNIIGKDYKYVHIGDNKHSDIDMALKMGYDARYYPNVNEIGNKYRATFQGMSECIGSAYGGIVNTYLHNGINAIDKYYEYGFIYGGIYVLGFCSWIYQYAKANNIDKILFLARDGDIYQKVFNIAFNDMPNEYVYWSRMPSIRLLAEKDRYDFLLRYVTHRKNDIQPMPISNILKMANLEYLTNELEKYGLNPNQYVTNESEEILKQMLIEHWDEIVQSFEAESLLAKEYFTKVIKDNKRVAVVDVGWQGSGPKAIKWLVEEKWKLDCEVDCLLACSHSFKHSGNQIQVLNRSLNTYIFNRMHNRNIYDYHLSTNSNTNNIMFELFTQSVMPTFHSFSKNDNGKAKFSFSFCEVENYENLAKMHQGIIEFTNLYLEHFKNSPFMLNIEGYDAYMPFRFLTRNIKLVKNLYSNFVITRNLGFDESKQTLETLGDLFRERKL